MCFELNTCFYGSWWPFFKTHEVFVGIYSRELTHRVKSVSMANFTSQEVTALQEGGNQVSMPFCAKTCAVYFFSLHDIIYFLKFISALSNTCSVQEMFILKNGMDNNILSLTVSKYLLVRFNILLQSALFIYSVITCYGIALVLALVFFHFQLLAI